MKNRTTAYHPKANGMIENVHRPLKTALKGHKTIKWSDALPTLLLGFRSAYKPDLNATTAQLRRGRNLRLPGEFLFSADPGRIEGNSVNRLREHVEKLRPLNIERHGMTAGNVHKDLNITSNIFIKVDQIKHPMQSPDEGPVVKKSFESL